MYREIIKKIVEDCEGAVAAVVMGFDGIAMDSYAEDDIIDIQTVGMEFSFVLNQVRKASEILEVGALEEVSIHSEGFIFLIHVLNEEYFLGLALEPEGNLGKGRFLMRMALSSLR